MPRVALKPGENSIATSTAKRVDPKTNKVLASQRGKGTWMLQWHVNIDGEVTRHLTKVSDATKSDCYAAANRLFDKLVEQAKLPGDGKWSRSSSMAAFVTTVAIPAVKANQYAKPLRDRTIRQYVIRLGHYAEQVGKAKISAAIVPKRLERDFKTIASEHGNPTASYTAKAVSKYVMDVLVNMQVIAKNPMKPRTFEVTIAEKTDEDAEGEEPRGLLPEERHRVVEHLLGIDPTSPACKRHSAQVMTAKRSNIVDMTLVQATCGLRVGEARQLRVAWLGDDGGLLTIRVPASVSKTHKSRKVPVLDQRVAERVRRRAERAQDGADGLIFPAPESGAVWDASNVSKAVRAFYDELADELDMPLLHERRSHVWRATLNSEWIGYDVPAEYRAAYFGHSPEVNAASYTDTVDVGMVARKVNGHM